MLVVHHTPLWTPLTSLTGTTAALMRDVLSAGMNIYVMHTNFDHAEKGVNDALAELLSLERYRAHDARAGRRLPAVPERDLPPA